VRLTPDKFRGILGTTMSNELWDTLLKFHREVAMPSIVPEIVGPLREEIAALDRKMESRFDGVYQRLDRLETDYHALSASMKRVEDRLASLETRMTAVETRMTALETRMTAVEQKLAIMPLRSELNELKTRMEAVEKRLTAIEHRPAVESELAQLRRRVGTLEAKIDEQEK
jgi:chromosome segregation ATPase